MIPAKALFPLCAESLSVNMSRILSCPLSEDLLIAVLRDASYSPYRNKSSLWTEYDNVSPRFKVRFVRDARTAGLFDYYDETLCSSLFLKCLIRNALENDNSRMRSFCDFAVHQPELCESGISNGDVIEYLQWLSSHTPSPKSTMAAVAIYYLAKEYESDIFHINKRLSPDQLQFIRENPDLKLII